MIELVMRRVLWPTWAAARRALVAGAGSLAVHGGVLLVALLLAMSRRHAAPPPPPELADPVDRWSGVTAAIGGERLVDVNVDALGGQAASPPAAAPAPAPVPVPVPVPAAPKPAADGIEPPPPPPKKHKPAPAPSTSASVSPSVSASASADPDAPPAPPSPPRVARHRPSGHGADGAGDGDGSKAGPFGAEGPSAVRSLGRAFTRAIPAACQADPLWGKLAVGDAGSIEVSIAIDETGHVTGWKATATDPPKALASLVKRTIASLDAGTFALKGSVGAGVEVLKIQATLSDVDTAEGQSAVALSFGEGKANFTQDSGRHVEVSLKVVRVEAAHATSE